MYILYKYRWKRKISLKLNQNLIHDGNEFFRYVSLVLFSFEKEVSILSILS